MVFFDRLGLASLDCQETLTSCDDDENFAVVYPYGATLALQKPAVAILSSGLMAHPVRQPIGNVNFVIYNTLPLK